jgi:hypothetical protein
LGTENAVSRLVATVKKYMDRRTERRKNDEDIAERISGGVRLERPAGWRDRVTADDQSHSADKPRRNKRRPSGR